MDLNVLRSYAEELLRGEGLLTGPRPWTFGFDRAKRRGGYCNYTRRHISVSKILMALYPEALAKDTVIHEVAHALAGPKAGHGRVWRDHALRLGGSGEVRLPASAPKPAPAWIGRCACGLVRGYHRKPAKSLMCPQCAAQGLDPHLTWQHTQTLSVVVTGPKRIG